MEIWRLQTSIYLHELNALRRSGKYGYREKERNKRECVYDRERERQREKER